MARKKRTTQDDWPEPTPDKQLESKSGWCSTDYHDNCPYQFRHGKCGCGCHIKKRKVK